MRYYDQDVKTTMKQTGETTVLRGNTKEVNTPTAAHLSSATPPVLYAQMLAGGCKLPYLGTGVTLGLWKSSNSTYLLSHLSCPSHNMFPNLTTSAPNQICSPTKLSEGNRLVPQVKVTQECQVSTAAITETNTACAKDELSNQRRN